MMASDGRFEKGYTGGKKSWFRKGHVPWNKGLKKTFAGGEEYQFRKGHMPHKHKPVGTIVRTKDGYNLIKTEEPKTWVLLQRIVWECENGPIPEGMIVKFKDGNKLNCDISNLYLSDRKMNMVQNTLHRYPEELKESIRALNKLKKLIYHGTEQN